VSGSFGAPAQGLDVVIRSTAHTTESGVLVLAQIDAPSVGVEQAYLILDPKTNSLGLMAPCGCHVFHELSGLVMSLADALARSHGTDRQGYCLTQRH
jgi:hypothetical protein